MKLGVVVGAPGYYIVPCPDLVAAGFYSSCCYDVPVSPLPPSFCCSASAATAAARGTYLEDP